MKVYQLDEEFINSRKKTWNKAVKIALIFIGIIWSVAIVDFLLPFVYLNDYGIHPRQFASLGGIFFTVFLHSGFNHLASNTLPLLLAVTALFGNYPQVAKKVLFLGIFLTGVLVWSFARNANHIGASGLLYCLLTFIFISGFLRRDIQSIGISLAIAFLYSSLVFGVLPNEKHISWESHLFGLLSGVFLAIIFRKKDRPVFKSYEFEQEDE